MDRSRGLELRSTGSNEETVEGSLDSAQELAELDQGNVISVIGRNSQANAETSDFAKFIALQTAVKSAANGLSKTNTAYLNLRFDSLKLATVKLMDPLKRCMVTPDTPRTCLIEEVRSTKDGELSKLLEYHLETVELNDYLPFNAMLLVAHGTTLLFQNSDTNRLTFSSLPYEVKGLKMVIHQQTSTIPGAQNAKKSQFSKTEIQDFSTESLKARGIRQLRFHTEFSKHDWQCFIDVNDSKYVSMFGDSELSCFEHIMAATIELFEHGRALHESRPLQNEHTKQYEVIARAKYMHQVERKRIALENWGQYLAFMDAQPRLDSRTRRPDSRIFRAPQKECASTKQEQLAVEANAIISGGTPSVIPDVDSGNEASAEDEADLDKVEHGRGKGKSFSVDLRDSGHINDISVNTTSGNAQKKGKGKRPRRGKGLRRRDSNTPSLAPRPTGSSTDEDNVATPEKSGSITLSKQHLPVNNADIFNPASRPAYDPAFRPLSHHTEVTDNIASELAEVVEMNDLSGRVSNMALGGDQERADEDRLLSNDCPNEDDGWQTVVLRRPRKSVDKSSVLPTSFSSRGAQSPMNRTRNTQLDPPTRNPVMPEPSSLSYPAYMADVAPALNTREFPSLPATTQSEEAMKKVMAKKKKKKDKRKKKDFALESEWSKSSSTPTTSSKKQAAPTQSELLADIVQQDARENQGQGSDGIAQLTDEDITPNASMINLAAASASRLRSLSRPPSPMENQSAATRAPSPASVGQAGSLAVPSSAMKDQSASTFAPQAAIATLSGSRSALPSADASQPHLTSAPPPAPTPVVPLFHKFGALEGPARIVCRMPGCDNTTSPWDGSTVICPSCGPYSSIRYCCIDHLLGDTADHWGLDCMKYTCHHFCDASTIHPRQVHCPPAIPNLCGWNTPERHRQAVYHAHSSKKDGFTEVEGDYFVFSDAEEWIQAGSSNRQAWGLRRARGTVLVVVTFDDARSSNALKDRFNRLLNIALFTGASNALLLDYLFLMIRDNLLSKGEWDGTILDSVVYQFQWEFCYHLPEWITNNLSHACPHQWFGTPLNSRTPANQCHDHICNREQLQASTRRPFGARVVVREKVEELERRYWILRVARVYHPHIQDPAQRMRGVGFSFVAPENKRQFCMGREWDGFPSGLMEIEGAIWVPNGDGPPRLQVANIMTLTV